MKKKITSFWLMPKERRQDITDSLLLNSGTEVFSAMAGGYDFSLRVQGNVKVVYGDDTFKTPSCFPEALKEAIRTKRCYHDSNIYIAENNWYELMVWDKDCTCVLSDVVDLDISELTEKTARELILDYLKTVRENAPDAIGYLALA